ncbi:MAG: cytochrome c oxidase assembly protein [Gammaproteobacteria bacterium]|nr:cytochrome c oxidase assembly protein [Gammaproteobacteria bacterium]MDH5653231.1 cytochrome c oxidase assembly protein [Gammaproteobacteria bacterium]
MSTGNNSQLESNQRVTRFLLVVVVVMFCFGFALAPMYEALCKAFGINGRFVEIEQGVYDADKAMQQVKADRDRQVTVQFTASRNQNLQWEFRPMETSVVVYPGEVREVKYYAKNLTGKTVVAQAVPSVSPGQAAKYFNKIECFCFTQQTFKPGEAKEMPLRFVVDGKLPKKISTLTLAYTFFDTDQAGTKSKAQVDTVLRVAHNAK